MSTRVKATEEQELLDRITQQIDRCSAYEGKLRLRRAVLREAATQLRLGRPALVVLARIQEQVPDAVATITPESAPVVVPTGPSRRPRSRRHEGWLRQQLEGLDDGAQ